MHPVLPWLPLLLLPFLVGLFSLISFMVSRMGWYQLAACYAAAAPPVPGRRLLAYARVGAATYKNVVRAAATPEGLWLTTWKILYIGHPPLFIPWSAFGPVQAQQVLWATSYRTTIACGGSHVPFTFSSEWLRQALPATVAGPE